MSSGSSGVGRGTPPAGMSPQNKMQRSRFCGLTTWCGMLRVAAGQTRKNLHITLHLQPLPSSVDPMTLAACILLVPEVTVDVDVVFPTNRADAKVPEGPSLLGKPCPVAVLITAVLPYADSGAFQKSFGLFYLWGCPVCRPRHVKCGTSRCCATII